VNQGKNQYRFVFVRVDRGKLLLILLLLGFALAFDFAECQWLTARQG
jgi:hypothetical protein